ncbi:MAG: Uma2 family endonuclease [Saprospiraceae bacterium]|nr:Uma2 family endonuclease [Saprospiraceae bacterium]
MTHLSEKSVLQLPLDHPWVLAADAPVSREAFERFCAENPLYRLELSADGKIIIMPPASFDSGFHELEIAAELRNFAKKHQIGIVLGPSAGYTLPDNSVRALDAAWISEARYAQLSAEDRKTFAPVVPEFVIEVRSETDSLPALKRKMTEVWIANGVQVAWLVDPPSRTTFVYRGAEEESCSFDEVVSAEPALGFGLRVGDLF